MMGPAQVRPVSLDTDREPIFGFVHEPGAQPASGTAVLIVGPWGWDEVVTYRSRRDWAEDLTRAGHPVLRIDLPGAGDSAGSDRDDDRVAAWSGAVGAAVTALRQRPGVGRVAVVGLGLGGLSAARAIDDGAPVDDLVLWAVPTTGRAWLREMRAFAGMQGTRFSLNGASEPRVLPADWLEVGGFVLTAATMAALEAVDLTTSSFAGVARVLLLDRDGMALDRTLRTHLEANAAALTIGSGDGWAAMCADIERHRPPTGVFATVASFLATAADSPQRAAPETASGAGVPLGRSIPLSLVLARDDARETPITLEQPEGRTFGVLAEPVGAARGDLCAIFLNAGAVRRIGPNRMWVDAARRWAARGIPSLRLDIEAIGDADGDPTAFADVNTFYRAGLERQITAAIDLLEERGIGRRFALVGLCSGAYWGFQVAVADDRVVAALLLNPRALIWDPHIFTRLAARDARKVLNRDSWQRLLRGRIGPRRLAGVARAVAVRVADGLRGQVTRRLAFGGQRAETVEGLLAGLDRRGTRLVLAFSDEEPLCGQFEDDGLPARFRRWTNAAFVRLPGRDHTVRPIVAQVAVQALIDEVLGAVLEERAAAKSGAEQDAGSVTQPSSPAP